MKRTILGSLAIMLAFAGLILWETSGRDILLTEDVLVAAQDISHGSVLSERDISVKSVPKENLVEGYLSKADKSKIVGHMISSDTVRNQQFSSRHIADDEYKELSSGKTYYSLKPEWIYMYPNSLKKGDTVEIISDDGLEQFGVFRVSCVKNSDGEEFLPDSFNKNIENIEIVAFLKDYLKIKSYADSVSAESLLIIQKW